MIQTVIRSLKLICENQTQWVEKLTPVLMSYRSTVSMAIGMSPYHALFGREMVTGIDTNLLQDFSKSPNIQSYMTQLVPRLQLTHEIIQQNLRDGQAKSKQYYDKTSEEPEIPLGQKVLVHDPTTKIGECPKFKRRWTGPYMVIEKSTDGLSYKLRHCDTGKELRSHIHINRLKKFNDDRDAFFNRHDITPQSMLDSPTSPTNDDTDTDTDWCPIKEILKRKVQNRKEMFLVRWDDKEGSQSWVLADDVTDFAIQQYYKAKENKKRRKRRRQ